VTPGLLYPRGRLGRLRLKCDGTRAETRFRLSPKRTIPFKSAGVSVQSTAGSRGVGISGSNAGYTMFRGSVKSTGYPLHSPVSPSLPLTCAITLQLDSTHCLGGWVSSWPGLDGCGKFRLHRDSIPWTVHPVTSRYTDYAFVANHTHNVRV
jgi:hypothetical protein